METIATIDYSAVLADLKKKREEIDRAIAGIEVIVGLAPSSASTAIQPSTTTIAEDAFFGLSIAEAAKKYLSIKKKPQTTSEIAAALKAGGLQNQSGNFGNTVGSVINRNVEGANQIFVRIGRGTFGLREWYPGIRAKSSKNGPQKSDADIEETGNDDSSEMGNDDNELA